MAENCDCILNLPMEQIMNGININRPRCFAVIFLVSYCLMFFIGNSEAAIFCVTNDSEISAALNASLSNGQDDEIYIVQGSYTGFSYIGSSSEPYGLAIEGGYTTDCASRVIDPFNTVIDGNTYYLIYGNLVLDGMTMQNGSSNRGGGVNVSCVGSNISVSVINNMIRNNTATIQGGGANLSLGGSASNSNSLVLKNNIITNNETTDYMAGGNGGGVYIYDNGTVNTITIEDNYISNNSAIRSGSGIMIHGNTATLTNNVISNNTSGHGAGAFGFNGDSTVLTNNTITGNTGYDPSSTGGGGVFIRGNTATLYNNIFWDNDMQYNKCDDLYLDTATSYIYNNDFDHDFPPQFDCFSLPVDTSNFDNANPMYVDSANGNYHLQAVSLLINAGTNSAPALPSTDKDGNPRIIDARVDMGAFENSGQVGNNLPAAEAGGPYSADEGQEITLNGSGSFDIDGVIVLYEWDIDNDGTYDYSAASPVQSHSYGQLDTYNIKLRVTDNNGATGESTTIAVIADSSPVADFIGLPIAGPAPLTVNFTNNSTGFDQPLTYEWDFENDGVTDSTEENPSHIYTAPGVYAVKLTAMDFDTDTGSLTRTEYVTVSSAYSLSVDVIGNGTVTSSPSGIDCGADCEETYNIGTEVILTTMPPDASTIFATWAGGSCIGPGDCIVPMDADINMTAIFIANSVLPVRVGGSDYSSIQAAYNEANEGDTIQVQAVTLNEDLNCNRSISVTLEGGYDMNYTVSKGRTSLKGTVMIEMGTIDIKSIIIE